MSLEDRARECVPIWALTHAEGRICTEKIVALVNEALKAREKQIADELEELAENGNRYDALYNPIKNLIAQLRNGETK